MNMLVDALKNAEMIMDVLNWIGLETLELIAGKVSLSQIQLCRCKLQWGCAEFHCKIIGKSCNCSILFNWRTNVGETVLKTGWEQSLHKNVKATWPQANHHRLGILFAEVFDELNKSFKSECLNCSRRYLWKIKLYKKDFIKINFENTCSSVGMPYFWSISLTPSWRPPLVCLRP